MQENSHASRKADHLDLCGTDDVAFRGKGTLLDQVTLVHDSLPELAVRDIDLTTELAGKTLRAPLVIAAMTGGVDRAERVNRDLAAVAQDRGIAFGFGSMRPLLEEGTTLGYLVRKEAPDALVFANIGAVQAARSKTADIARMIDIAGCDALCVHLNPAQEVVQPEGDDDFRGGYDALARLVQELEVPVIAKETGCGLSRKVGKRLVELGIQWVDTSGAGGTSWVGVETLRAEPGVTSVFASGDWGIPTAGTVAQLSDLGLGVIATGGVKHGLDIARAIALGARAGGMARPFLMAWNDGGREAVANKVDDVVDEIATAHLLTGCRTPQDLRQAELVLGTDLLRWVPRDSSLRGRQVSA